MSNWFKDMHEISKKSAKYMGGDSIFKGLVYICMFVALLVVCIKKGVKNVIRRN